MTHFKIKAPIWNGGQRCVGLNVQLLHGVEQTFEIEYTTKKTKKRSYPNMFTVPTAVVMTCPRQTLKPSGVILAIVPLEKCTEVKPLEVPSE